DVSVKRLNRRWVTLLVPKVGPVRFRLSRPMPATYGMARVTVDRAGRWHVSFSAPQPGLEREPTGQVVGLDAGVLATLTTSEGTRRAPGVNVSQKRGSNRVV